MRECYTLILARFFTDPVLYFVIFWLPEYLRKERGFDLAMVGKYAWVPYLFGDIGYMLGGWLSGRLMQAGWTLPRARKSVMLMGACCMPVAIAAPHVPEAWMAIAATCFLTFGHAFWVSNHSGDSDRSVSSGARWVPRRGSQEWAARSGESLRTSGPATS